MRRTNYKCIVGSGEILLTQNGEGNNQLTTIEFQGDQFSMIELKKKDSVVQLSFRGEWEINELGQALNEHGANWEGLEPKYEATEADYEMAEMFAEHGDLRWEKPNLLQKIKAYFVKKWAKIF